jgi:SAM-dependent methyltransferase
MTNSIPKSSQDRLGKWLSKWRNNRVAKEINPPFLDIGCGDNVLAKKLKGGIGIDIVNYGNLDLIVKDFYDLPFKRESFNSVAIVASLNYFGHTEKVLSECERVLRPNGTLILTLLNPLIGKFWHLFREPWAKFPGFSSQELERLTRGAGLQIVKRSKFMLGMNNLYILKKL